MKIGILIPHIFAQESLKNKIIFAPLQLGIQLADELKSLYAKEKNSTAHEVFLFTPGKIKTTCKNITVFLKHLNDELNLENCSITEFAVKNPLAFTGLSRQIHAELTRKAFEYAQKMLIDVLLVYMCEDEIPLYFSNLINIPVFFTHHDPFNFYRKYRVRFPSLSNLNYISISYSQRETAPKSLHFVKNIYNGINFSEYMFYMKPDNYFCTLGRIIQNKGVHTAIDVCRETDSVLKIAGKHYSAGDDKDNSYWEKYIKPNIDQKNVFYEGFLKPPKETSRFLGKARALLFPIEWEEPFGLVMIEALACGTPVIAFDRGSVKEIIKNGKNGFIVKTKEEMMQAMKNISSIDRRYCRLSVEKKFSIQKMAQDYKNLFEKYTKKK